MHENEHRNIRVGFWIVSVLFLLYPFIIFKAKLFIVCDVLKIRDMLGFVSSALILGIILGTLCSIPLLKLVRKRLYLLLVSLTVLTLLWFVTLSSHMSSVIFGVCSINALLVAVFPKQIFKRTSF